jgi:hypothetical protein
VTIYTVTITSDTGGQAEATVKLDIDDGVARVTEFIVRPPRRAGTPEGHLSGADFELLMRAVQPALMAVDAMEPGAVGPRGGSEPRSGGGGAGRVRKRTGAPSPANTGVDDTEAPQHTGSARKRAPATIKAGRVYRRMPADLAARFAETGSVTGLAAHYGVPRHTAQGWINRMRRQHRSG